MKEIDLTSGVFQILYLLYYIIVHIIYNFKIPVESFKNRNNIQKF